jgi:peroxiredoxin
VLPIVVAALGWILVVLAAFMAYQLLRENGLVAKRLVEMEGYIQRLRDNGVDHLKPPAPPKGLPLGVRAPAFELPDLRGRRVSLERFRGERVLLIFFSPTCSFCKQLAPSLSTLAPDGPDGRPIPLVITTGNPEANRAIVAENGIRCPVLLQQETEVSSRYAALGTPAGYLIDESGAIASGMAVGAMHVMALAQPQVSSLDPRSRERGN